MNEPPERRQTATVHPSGVTATLVALLSLAPPVGAQQPTARELAPWLDVPAAWSRTVEGARIAVVPNDLPRGASLLFIVEPPVASGESLAGAYGRAIGELGRWRPVGEPTEQGFETGWTFRFGIGVVELDGRSYTALAAVARKGDRLARFWALADADDTYNRYQAAVMTGISSVQDIDRQPVAAAPPSPSAAPAPPGVDAAFGTGVTGAYLGLERGVRASAGAGGQELVLDLATGFLSVGNAPGAPQVRTSVQDYLEVDVLLADGSYRRGLPVRGLAGDLAWDRAHLPVFWGTWRREGDRIVTQRGSYVTAYTLAGDRLVSERDRPWRKLPLLANARVEGSFARADYRDADAPRLVLRRDGTYEDRGDFLRMVGSAWHLVVPDGDAMLSRWSDAEARRALAGGSGTYVLDAFTLTLRDRDGRVWQVNAYVPPSETLPAPRYFVVNGYVLIRD